MKLVAIGDNIVDCYPEARLMFPGGNCANVAVYVSRAGLTSGYVGRVGDDDRGELIRSALMAERVDLSRVAAIDGPTGYATVHQLDGERAFGDYDRGVAPFSPEEADLRYCAEFDLIHTSYSAQLEAEIHRLAALAPVSFDFDAHGTDAYAEQLIGHVTHAFFSAAHLSEEDAEDLLAWACARGARSALATRGPLGALYRDEDGTRTQPASPTRVLDTLGAGDAFIAYTLAGQLTGRSPARFLRAAADAAARVCSSLGAFGHAAPLTSHLIPTPANGTLTKEPS